VRTTKWRESRQSSGRRRRKRKEGNNDTQEEEEEDAEEMHALPPHLAYILLSISAHKSSDAKRSSYFPCSFLLLLLPATPSEVSKKARKKDSKGMGEEGRKEGIKRKKETRNG
jgi:hypothetical protein